jgi:DNA excision repair protein ERCC-4
MSVSVDGQEIPEDLGDDDWGTNMTDEEEAMLQMMEIEQMERQGIPGAGTASTAATGNSSSKSGTGGLPTADTATAANQSMPPPPLPDIKPKTPSWRNGWVPPNVEPVLEEQPKWSLLADVLDEIENDLHWSAIDTCE